MIPGLLKLPTYVKWDSYRNIYCCVQLLALYFPLQVKNYSINVSYLNVPQLDECFNLPKFEPSVSQMWTCFHSWKFFFLPDGKLLPIIWTSTPPVVSGELPKMSLTKPRTYRGSVRISTSRTSTSWTQKHNLYVYFVELYISLVY